jgi:serine/threonine protein kinase
VPIEPGTRIGSYEVIALLGAGGMGEVYRARDSRLKRDVAIKVLPDLLAGDPGSRAFSARQSCSRR